MSIVPDHPETMIAVSLTDEEIETLRQLSTAEHLPEDVLLRKWVIEGLNQLRLARACTAYECGELNLGGAAYYAGIGVEQMMRELPRRGIGRLQHKKTARRNLRAVFLSKALGS